jgi:NADPH:quinone reductase
LGRRVVAHLGAASGGSAEGVVASVAALHDIPDHVGGDAAVAMIGTGRTALAILDLAALIRDDAVLVTAAAGRDRSLLVQAARNAGAVVIGAAGGPDKTERVRALGATAVDYLQPDWADRLREDLGEGAISVVLDGVSGPLGRGWSSWGPAAGSSSSGGRRESRRRSRHGTSSGAA